MSGFGSMSDIAPVGDRALDGVSRIVFNRGDCEIVYFQPGIGPDDIVMRDMLMRYAEHGHA